jgi:RimJ/RimL family protein N-acetyltransferase
VTDVRLREVVADDLPVLFAQQADAESAVLASVPSREQVPYEAHMAKILADAENVYLVIDLDGTIAGSVLSFRRDGRRLVGYWIDRPLWGRGLATAALGLLLEHPLVQPPLHAEVATHNPASRRVLEKHGFAVIDTAVRDGVELWTLELA